MKDNHYRHVRFNKSNEHIMTVSIRYIQAAMMPQAARPNVAPVASVRNNVVPTTVAHGQCPPGNGCLGEEVNLTQLSKVAMHDVYNLISWCSNDIQSLLFACCENVNACWSHFTPSYTVFKSYFQTLPAILPTIYPYIKPAGSGGYQAAFRSEMPKWSPTEARLERLFF